MVMRNRIHSTVILSVVIISVLCLQVASQTVPSAQAQITYVVSKEWSKIWVNKDGSIDLMCNITMSYTSGSPQGIVTVGMPKGGFQVEYVRDISGSSLQYSDASSGSFHGIDVSLKKPIVLNQPNTFIVFVVVPGMVSSDSTNTGNVGMQFSPSTFASASGPIGNVRVAMVLPQGVNSSQVKYPTGVPFDNVFNDPAEENKLVVYWERNNWSASQQFMVGVSFPERYMYDTTPPSLTISSPVNNSTIKSSLLTDIWNGTDAHSGINHYEVKVDDGTWSVRDASQTSYTFGGLKDGTHTVYVKAFDNAGNTNQSLAAFITDTSVQDTGMSGLLTTISVLALIIISLAFVYHWRRTRQPIAGERDTVLY
jgi:hypothetical protein